jgi:glutaredoxin-related protein
LENAKIATGTIILQKQVSRFSNNTKTPICQLCSKEIEDILHFIVRCSALQKVRSVYTKERRRRSCTSWSVWTTHPELWIAVRNGERTFCNAEHLTIKCKISSISLLHSWHIGVFVLLENLETIYLSFQQIKSSNRRSASKIIVQIYLFQLLKRWEST